MSTTAFVTGANGYIAQHLIKLLLNKNYKVVGTVRSESKGERLKSLFKSGFEYVVVSDIVKLGAFDKALSAHPEVSVVFHTASPVSFSANDLEKDIIEPAVQGTVNALSSIKDHGKNVKKVVLLSSIASIGFGFLYKKDYDDSKPITEQSRSYFPKEHATDNGFVAYLASKTYAEEIAWEFVKTEKPTYEFSVVNPSYVWGPQAFDSEVKETNNASVEILLKFLKLKATDPLPTSDGLLVDVRNVAEALYVAATSEKAVNENLLLINGGFTSQAIANILHQNFPQLDTPVGTPDKVGSAKLKYDNSKTHEIVGYTPIPLEKTVVDTVSQYLAAQK